MRKTSAGEKGGPGPDPARYAIDAVLKACEVLKVFQGGREAFRLRDVTARTGIPKATVHRLMCSLEQGGMIARVGRNEFRSMLRSSAGQGYRIGYAVQGSDLTFSQIVTKGLVYAAECQDVELIVADNEYSSERAIENANLLVRKKVDLAIEFQSDEKVASVISQKYLDAGIPVIAIDIPHPGATFYGANNYAAGVIGGRWLARWTGKHWAGEVDRIVLLEMGMAGAIPRSRLLGSMAALKQSIPNADSKLVHLEGKGRFQDSFEAMKKYLLRGHSKRMLVVALNDESGLGALQAFEEAGVRDCCALLTHNGTLEARNQLRQPGSRLVGSVAFFPELYGAQIMRLALDILGKRDTPPAVFIAHQVLTPDNVDSIYGADLHLPRSTFGS